MVASAGFTELERYGEYLALHLGESLDGWWTHSHSCNKSELRSLPHAEGKPDYDYPPYQISNGNQMVRGPSPSLSHVWYVRHWSALRRMCRQVYTRPCILQSIATWCSALFERKQGMWSGRSTHTRFSCCPK